MADRTYIDEDGVIERLTEIRRNEYVNGFALQEGAIPGGTLHSDTDNAFTMSSNNNINRIESTGPFDAALWSNTLLNGGTVGHTESVSGEMFVRTNTTANGSAIAQALQSNRQMSGTSQKYTIVVRLSDLGSVGNVRRWGHYDSQNGYGYQLDGTTFSLFTRKNGVDTLVPYGTWNGPVQPEGSTVLPFDLTKMQQYDILFGGLSCRWLINGRNAHSIGTNTISSPLTAELTLPFRQESTNTGGLSTDHAIFSRGQSFRRLGPSTTIARYRTISTATTTLVKTRATTLHAIVINNPAPGGTISLFDSLTGSGQSIGVISLGASTNSPFELIYDLETNIGLTVVTSAAVNVTVIFD